MLRHTRRSTASGAVSASDSSLFEAELSEAKLLQAAFTAPSFAHRKAADSSNAAERLSSRVAQFKFRLSGSVRLAK
jgi:hypothetical protein